MKQIHVNILILFLLFFINISLFGCSSFRLSSHDCGNINIEPVEKAIYTLELNGKIRPDQTIARKESMRKSWDEYLNGQLTCEELCKKAHYHTDGLFSCQ